MNKKSIKPSHGFEDKEFEYRINRAHNMMLQNKLDALLITTPQNFRYFTGFDSNFWESPTRPWFLIIPINKDPIAVIPSIGETALKKTWVENIFTWKSPNPNNEGVTLLTDKLNQINNKNGEIGLEMGAESTLRMPIKDYLTVKNNLKGFKFSDGSKILWDLRKIKTRNEIKKLRYICELTSDAFEILPKQISIGDTERSVCRQLKINIINLGADNIPFMGSSSGKGGYDQIIFEPTDRILGDKDLLFIDTGANFDGYFCDFDRNFGFNSIEDKVYKAYETTWIAVSAGIKSAVPNNKFSDVFSAMNKVLIDGGSKGNGVGRMGHGFGLQLTEPPSFMYADDNTLEAGMAVTIEPVFEFENGNMIVIEENIIINKDGNELITKRAPKEIPIIK